MRARDPFWDLVGTAKRLQAPGGCAWDRAQTVTSLLPYLIEETWEVYEAARSRRRRDLQEELGDALYTVLFVILAAERRGRGVSLESVLRGVREKMVRRHPHVFGGRHAATPQAAYRQWHATKERERRGRHSPSKAFREMLVAWWDWHYTHPQAGLHLPPSTRDRRRRQLRGARRRTGRLVANRPRHPVPQQRKRQSNRKAE